MKTRMLPVVVELATGETDDALRAVLQHVASKCTIVDAPRSSQTRLFFRLGDLRFPQDIGVLPE